MSHAARNRRHAALRQTGFSLVELLVASAVGVILTLMIATVFANSSKTGTVTQTVNEIEEQAGIALEMLQRDLRQAGYSGCNSNRALGSGGFVNTITTPTAYLDNIGQYLQGHDGSGAGFTPAAPSQITAANPAAVDEADALTVRVPAQEPVALSATMASGNAVVPVFSTAGFAVGSRALVSDCARSAVFRVTGLTGGLQHSLASNSTTDLGRAFGIDATVVPFNTISYYVGPSSIAPLGTERSLWRRVEGAAASEEIAEGVEEFQLLYGLDTDGDLSADLFDTADNVANWAQVIAVRASLLMRSKVANAARNEQDYDFNGQTDVAPGDLRMRRPYNVTILLRNRTI
jgi:type IV pilus assembly protein PilW